MIDVAAKVFGVILLLLLLLLLLKHSSPRGTSALALIKVALGLDMDARMRCTTYVAHWSSVGASSKLLLCASLILLPMADNGGGWNAPKLSRLIKAYYASTRMKVRASGSDSLPFEIRSGGRKGCALSPYLFNYIID